METRPTGQDAAEAIFLTPVVLFLVFFIAGMIDFSIASRPWRVVEMHFNEAKQMHVLRGVIEKEKGMLVRDRAELKRLRAIPLEVRLSWLPYSAVATCFRTIYEREQNLKKQVYRWNRWQYRYNSVIMGTHQFQELLM